MSSPWAAAAWRWAGTAGRVTGLAGLEECPAVATAADGTAAIAGSAPFAPSRIVVRRAGGAFGAPVTLAQDGAVVTLAAAPGGWVAAIWVDPDDRLRAQIFAPD